MNRGKRLAVVSAFLLIGLVFYAASPLAAHADDSTPQPPPPADTTTPVPDGSTGGGSNPADATAVAVQPIAPDLSGSNTSSGSGSITTTSLTGSTTTGQDSTSAGATSAAPAGPSVAPLATATPVTVLAPGDPIWCPSASSPSAGSGGCSGSYANLAALISGLSGTAQPIKNGTIWITNGTDTSAVPLTLDGATLTTWTTHALALQGGWDGTTSGNIVGQTTITQNLNIANWANDISLNNLIFSGAGAKVATTGNIFVNDVEVKNRVGVGLELTNITGIGTKVDVTNGNFHGNTSTGLIIDTNGAVTLSNVIASSNGSLGARITTNGAVTIDQGAFNSNAADGLNVSAGDTISLNQVAADSNNAVGVTHAGAWLLTTNGDIKISNSTFNGNQDDGLQGVASGSIFLNNVNANNNNASGVTYAGAYLQPGSLNDNVTINTGSFSNNKSTGLWVNDGGGVTTINNVTANGNDTGGGPHPGTTILTGSVSIGSSVFNNNSWDGLQVTAVGPQFHLANVSASGNAHTGANLSSVTDININTGSFNSNGYDGLDASALGLIRLGNVTANSNDFGGVTAAGADLASGGSIIIKPNSSFSGNNHDGLHAATNGNISLDGVSANANDIGGAGVAGSWLTAGLSGSISINGSAFSDNYGDALHAIAGNALTVTNVTANGNQRTSHNLAGTYLSAAGPVNINYSTFNGNQYDGLLAASTTMLGTQGNQNDLGGHLVAGTVLNSSGPVTLTSASFSNNKYEGLNAMTTSNIALVDVVANSNQVSGVGLAGTVLVAGGSISIDPSSFSHNTGVGLIAKAGTALSMQGVGAKFNGGNGVEITAGSDAGSLCGTYEGNNGYGVDASLPGTFGTRGDVFQGNVSGDWRVTGGGVVQFGGWGPCEGKVKYKTPTAPPAYILGATPAATPAAASPQLNVLNVTDGQTVNLDCTTYSGTTLALSNRDQIILLCPVTGQATLKHLAVDALPSKLDSTMTYQSAMDAQVSQNGQTATTLNGPMKVDFVIPSGVQGTTNLSIQHWDGTKWVDVGGTATPDGFIETITNQTGTFVLVSR
jgi:hypothetical protein